MAVYADCSKEIFGPLTFKEENAHKENLFQFYFGDDVPCLCVICSTSFLLPSQQQELLQHMFMYHKLVIADVQFIGSIKSYLDYWRIRFGSYPITDFCTTFTTDPDGTGSEGEIYYLLSDVLPEDKLLRESLQQKRLEWALDFQTVEREDETFSRQCLFCRFQYTGKRKGYVGHLSQKHNLQLGNPENLVFIDKLLETIEEKLNRLQCIYCENIFKDKPVLKEHMRKKFHKRINPHNHLYDKFFIINYLEIGKTWLDVQKERDPPDSKLLLGTDDWSDWDEECFKDAVVCLFCDQKDKDFVKIIYHIRKIHGFDFLKFCEEKHLNFYNQVKVVNFIRHKVYKKTCIFCETAFEDQQDLLKHMNEQKHFVMPSEEAWNQPLYFFPTYENDAFLQNLDDGDDDDDDDEEEEKIFDSFPDTLLCSNMSNLQVDEVYKPDAAVECSNKAN